MITNERNKIKIYSFIMSIAVIFVHAINNESFIQNFVSYELCQYAVPSFFIMSGLLFFINIYNIKDVLKKIKKRIYTVLFPFFMWNVIYYLFNLIFKSDVQFSLNELYIAAVTFKYNPVYWYMYQLIILICLSPIIFYLIKNIKVEIATFILIFILIIFDIKDIVNYDALFYFYLGASFSNILKRKDNLIISKNNLKMLFFCFFITLSIYILMRFFLNYLNHINIYIMLFRLIVIINRAIGSIFIFYLIDLFFDYHKNFKIMDNNFFLYSIHYLFTRALAYILSLGERMNIDNIILENIIYFLTPIISIILSDYISSFMKKYMNGYYKILTGGR